MCGIAGTIGQLRSDSEERVAAMLDAIVHRGPDQHGLWGSGVSGPGVVLGHRRLSILDVSEAGRQPMVHAESGVVICYNGECYNFVQLRTELEQLGHRFVSNSDTEVILAAYVQWGPAVIARLRGMFAIALWDPKDRSLLLARDRMGIKPLYYCKSDDQLWFASEVRALLAADVSERKIDQVALSSYLWHGFVHGPRTLVRGIALLPAGTMLRISEDGRAGEPQAYGDTTSNDAETDKAEATSAAGNELEKSINMRLVSDVPLGVFLSGGVDSSVVATLAQRASSRPIQTFNISFEGTGYDEASYAQQVSDALGTEHHRIPLTEKTFQDGLGDALDSLDQPTFDGINTYFVSKAVRDAGITVALSGAGGDELFGGYASFRDLPTMRKASRAARFVPSTLRGFAADLVSRIKAGGGAEIPPQTRWGKLRDVLDSGGDLVALYQCAYALYTSRLHSDLQLQKDKVLNWGLEQEMHSALTEAVGNTGIYQAISTLELSSFIGERLLRDTDTASMAVSLEVRVPLLDHRFVEAVSAVETSARYQPIGRKQFLRDLMGQDVPPEIFERPKSGFELPLELWCKQSLGAEMERTFQDTELANAIGLDGEVVARLWRAFNSGGPGLYWSRVWAIFVLMRWCRRNGVYA